MQIRDCISQIKEQGFYVPTKEVKEASDSLQVLKTYKKDFGMPESRNHSLFEDSRQFEKANETA